MSMKHIKMKRSKKRIVAFVVCVALVLGGVGFATVSYADDLTDPYEPDIYWFLDDTKAASYSIYSTAELYGLAQLVNGTAVNPDTGDRIPAQSFKGVTFTQEENLTLCKPSQKQEWTPIGTKNRPFSGIYDGNGHTLRGMTITNTFSNAGFIGYASSSSYISNLTMTSSSLYLSSIDLTTDTKLVENVGSIVGYCAGTISNCSSKVPITITSKTKTSKENTSVLACVGGIAGKAIGNMYNSSYTGSGAGLTIKVYADSYNEDLRTCHSIGGVVGRFGDPDDHGSMYSCFNGADIWVVTEGAGASDRFGITTYARPYFVGGVCGYANGSIYNSHNGVYDGLYGRAKGTVQTSATDSISGTGIGNRGGDEVGGVVGAVRAESDDPNKYNDGNPDDKIYVQNCYNLGTVVGACAVGGVAGQAGAYCYVTQSYNGMAGNEDIGHVVSTRWNKPCTGGIMGQGRGASVSYCANYALIENVQTGYYTAGVVGTLWRADDYPNLQVELYASFNSGHVYTANRELGTEFREAGICGSNEGYVHDCVMLYGTVPYHDNSPIGANDWGLTSNLNVLTMEEMQTSYCAALLNEANGESWDVYWFMNSESYPVLNVWEDADSVTELSASSIAKVEITKQATYLGPTIEPVPTLSITLTSGRVLWQNTDFYVVPQEGACDVTREGETPYNASIVGLGRFSGRVDNVCMYGIGKGDLSRATIAASSGKYNNGKAVYPSEVHLIMGGAEVDKENYSYRIYDYNTNSLSGNGMHYVIFDSDGYVAFKDSNVLEPLSTATLTGDYVLYDRNKTKISDSDGNVYNPDSGSLVSGTYACSRFKNGSPAGYVIEAVATSSAIKFVGSTTGIYSVSTASLKDDVTIEKIECEGQTWYWDSESATIYALNDKGEVDLAGPSVVFTGKEIKPQFSISYLDQSLQEGSDYRVVYGDPNNGDYNQSLYGINTSATTQDIINGFTVRSADSSRFSNYLPATFTIKPAKFEDCKISIENTEYAFTGQYIVPKVSVTLNGVTLKENRDYTISFSNNLYRGEASYTVTALNNLSGGKTKTYTGTFQIGDGIGISQYTLDTIEDPVYNFGQDPRAIVVMRDKSGKQLALKKGRDYEVSFSSCALGSSEVIVTGIGKYKGTLRQNVTILPLDVENDIYGQVKVKFQDMTYGTWKPDYSESSTTSLLPRYNISSSCPVMSVEMYPVVDWGNEDNNYTVTLADTPYNTRSSQSIIGSVGAYYFDESGKEVNFKTAEPGKLQAEVRFNKYTQSGKVYGCSGSIKKTVDYLIPVDITKDVEWKTEGGCTYDGQAQTPVYGINKGTGNKLVEGKDYSIEYKENTNVGIAEYTVTAIEGGRYTGQYTSTFSILALDLSTVSNISRINNQEYTGTDIEPKPDVYVGKTKLVEGVDYTLAYMHNTAIGTARVYITGMGNYTGRTSKTFKIVGDVHEITKDCIKAIPDFEYTGSAITPVVTVTVDAVVLIKNNDYRISFQNNIERGTAIVIVEGLGKYNGVVQSEFKIVQSSLKTAKVKLPSSYFIYDAKAKKPTASVTKAGRTLKLNTDYTVSYSNNTGIGVAKVILKGKGNYKDSQTVSFNILPKGTTIKKITKGKKKATVKWKKQTTQTTAYQIRYSLKKNMKSSKTKTIKNVKTAKTTIKKLKSKKTYYMQIRTYKKIGKKYYCSPWSKTVKIKVK